MKKFKHLHLFALTLGIAFLGTSCDLAEDNDADLPSELMVASFSDVEVRGQVKVSFLDENAANSDLNNPGFNSASFRTVNTAGSLASDDVKIKINANNDLRSSVKVYTEGGTLIIDADDRITLSDGVTIEVYNDQITEIRLERDEIAEIYGFFDQEFLSIVTEANSKLALFGFRVDHLTCKTEGESQVVLDSSTDELKNEISIAESRGVLINSNILLVDGLIFYRGESIVRKDGFWVISGTKITSYFESESIDFVTEGKTTIDAIKAPARLINIKLEGESQASVWATQALNGKAEGSSKLYYANVPGLNLTNFKIEGGAVLIPVN